MNKVIRFKGNSNNVPKETGNFYIDGDKAVFIDQEKKMFVFANEQIKNDAILMQNKLKMLEQQLLNLKTKNALTITTAQNVNEPEQDIVITNEQDIVNKTNIVAKSIVVKKQNIQGTAISYNATDDVNISNLTTNGQLNKQISNAQVSVNNGGYVQITNCTIGQTGYNGIEIGLQKTVKSVLIDNVNFASNLTNNALSIFDTENNAIITISNCNFKKCSNPIRISNRSGNKITINIINCNFEQWESGKYAGCILCQDYTSTSKENALQNNLFSKDKVTFNFINCYHNGEKIQFTDAKNVCGTKNENQLVYVYTNKEGFIEYQNGDRYPTITAK